MERLFEIAEPNSRNQFKPEDHFGDPRIDTKPDHVTSQHSRESYIGATNQSAKGIDIQNLENNNEATLQQVSESPLCEIAIRI